MQKHYSYITIDLDKKIYTKLKAVQGDSKSRCILANLIANNVNYDLSGTSVKVYGVKKDKTIFFNDATIIDATKGQFEIELTNQALAIAGDLKIQILILGPNQEKLSTFSFFIEVAESIIDDAAIESSNEFKALTTSLSKLEEWNGYFEETSGKIEEKYTERLNKFDEQFNTIINEKAEKKELEATNNRISNIVANNVNGEKDVELADARTGADGKVYVALKDRLDNENLTKINKLIINNIVVNSNLDGQTGWNFLLANGSISNNECVFTATARYGAFYQFSPKNPIIGHKYYISAMVKATSNKVSLDFYNSSTGMNFIRINHSGSGNYERLSTVQIVNSNVSSRYRVLDDRESEWDTISCKEFVLVDLTEMFGVGNEPSLVEFEELIYKNSGSYFVENNLITNAFVSELFPKKVQEKQKYPILLYKNNNDLTVAWKYNNLKDIRLHIEPIGANGLYQVGRIAFVDNNLDYVTDDFKLNETLYQAGVTDWIAPYIMKAINNADGDKINSDYNFVGGAHSYENTSLGVPTARLLDIQIKIDGNNISSNGVYYAHKINVICTNRIQGNNTKKKDGTGREILEEEVTFTITQGVIDIENKIKPLEEIRIDRYYGLQAYTQKYKSDGGTVYYVNGKSNTIYPLGVSDSGTLADGSSCRKMIVSTNEHNFSLELSDIGLTNKRLINDTDKLAFWSGDKLYFQVISKHTDLQLGDMLYLHGTYRFSSK